MTTIKLTESGTVVLSYVDGLGDAQRDEFMVPHGGGYVRRWDGRRSEWTQVFGGIGSYTGQALECGSREQLPALIRREWRRARKALQS